MLASFEVNVLFNRLQRVCCIRLAPALAVGPG
jgi:hypothetical protein